MTDLSPPAATQKQAPQQPQVLLLSPANTDIRFSTRHLFGLGRVVGSVDLLDGQVEVDAMGGALLSVQVQLDMTTFASASRARDKAVTSARLMDVGQHPRAIYRSATVEPRAGGWLVSGSLTAKGVTSQVDLTVDGFDTTSDAPIHATARVDRFAYGITIPRAMASQHLRVDMTVRTEPLPQP